MSSKSKTTKSARTSKNEKALAELKAQAAIAGATVETTKSDSASRPQNAPETIVVVKRALQSKIVGADYHDKQHDADIIAMTRRVHQLNLGRDIFGARLNSRTADVNTVLMLASAPLTTKQISERSAGANVANDLAAKISRITVTFDNVTAPVCVHELGAYRLSDTALKLLATKFNDAPALVMLKSEAPAKSKKSK